MLRACALRPIIRSNVNRYMKSAFHSTIKLNAGSVLKMPAMSPTMSEGGVVSWKYKSGEEFASGDVILEVETDKATVDVEAQDDGVMWEILVNEGAEGVAVGKPIALLAEPGDDLASLEKPALEDSLEKPALDKEPKEEAPKEQKLSEQSAEKPVEKKTLKQDQKEAKDASGVFASANSKQKLSPAVELLLHNNKISFDDAISKIPASGPKGRLLKGDVLAYIGAISKDSVASISKFIKSREHLDLSNIQLAEPKADKPDQQKPQEPEKPSNILTVELSSEFAEDVSREKFKYAFEKSIDSAIRNTYSSKFPEYSSSPTPSSRTGSDLFDDLMAPLVTKKRFEVYGINYNYFESSPLSQKTADAFDEILGISTTSSPVPVSSSDASRRVNVDFKIKFDQSLSDSKDFVEYFENSLLSQIPTNKLKISN